MRPPDSNRRPTDAEVAAGAPFVADLARGREVVAVGRVAHRLLGGAYVAIEPAGMDALQPGAEILYTQGSVDLLTLFAGFAQGQGNAPNQDNAP